MRALAWSLILLGAGSARAEAPELVGVQLTHEAPLERGRATPLSIGITLAPGLRLLEDAPLVLALDGSALQPERRQLTRRDAVDPRAETPRFELEVRADRAGTPSLVAHLTAWVCRGRRCRPVEVTSPLSLTVAPEHARPERKSP